MGILPLLFATAAVLFCLPGCFGGEPVQLKVEEQKQTPPKQCRGTLCPLVYLEQIYYAGLIEVGSNKQPIFVQFDTGSSQLWVASSLMCANNSQYCGNHKTYDHSKSTTYVKDGTPATIEYVDGKVTGFYSKDDIKVGSLTVKSQDFVEATSINLQTEQTSGVFGLGLLQNGAPDPPLVKMARTKVIDRAVFAFYFNRQTKGSELIIGGVNPKHFQPPFVPVDVALTGSHWTISIDKILVNNVEVVSAYPAVVDSGCTHIAGSPAIIDKIHNGQPSVNGMFYVNCRNISSFPTVTIVIKRVNFVLRPQDYFLNKGRCESGFTVVENFEQLVLGNVWMRAFYTMFDLDKRQVAFARAK